MTNKSNDNLWTIPILRSFWIVLTGSIALLIYIFILSQDLPSIEQLENFDPSFFSLLFEISLLLLIPFDTLTFLSPS